jgi:hypothetical protein
VPLAARIVLDGHQPRLSRLHPSDYLRYPGAFCRSAGENVEWCLPVPHAPRQDDRRQIIRRHDAIAASTCAGFSGLDTKMVL